DHSTTRMEKFAQETGARSTLSDGLGCVHARKTWTQNERLPKRVTMVSTHPRIRESWIRGLVRLGGGQLWLGGARRMEAGTSGKSSSIIFDPTCSWRPKCGRFAKSAHPRSRASRTRGELQ